MPDDPRTSPVESRPQRPEDDRPHDKELDDGAVTEENDDEWDDEPIDPRVIIPDLRPRLDPRFALGWKHLAAVAFFSVLFLFLNNAPLRPTDLWGHVTYGNWIIDHRALPSTDPFCPTVKGIPITCTAWLSQVTLAAIDRLAGAEWLSNLFAMVMTAYFVIVLLTIRKRLHSPWAAAAGLLFVFWISWSRLWTIRPENMGMLLFAVLLFLIADLDDWWRRPRREKAALVGVPILFLLWANLHGSFLIGLFALGAMLAGRVIVLMMRRGPRVGRLLGDRRLKRWALLLVLAVAASCINPYGPLLIHYAAGFTRSSPALNIVQEWQGFSIHTTGSMTLMVSLVILIVAIWTGRRSVNPGHFLMLLVLALATLSSIRMIAWYAPIAGLMLAPQIDFILRRWRRRGMRSARASALATDPAESTSLGQNQRLAPCRPDTGPTICRERLPSHEVGEQESETDEKDQPEPPMVKVKQEPIERSKEPSDADPKTHQDEDDESEEDEEEDRIVIPKGRSFYISLVCLLLIWCSFALSPISAVVLPKPKRNSHQLYDQMTPIQLPEAMKARPDLFPAPVFHPQWYGDYLVHAGPADFKPFITTMVLHVIPEDVAEDYVAICLAEPTMFEVIDRRGFNTIVLDTGDHRDALALRGTIKKLIEHPDWILVRFKNSDSRSAIFIRRSAMKAPSPPADPSAVPEATEATGE